MFDQPIPSPWDMPVFKFVEDNKMAQFFIDYNEFESDTTPDFTGKRVTAYIKLKDVLRRVQQLKKGFVPSSTNDDYFDQCPESFDKENIKNFGKRFESEQAHTLIKFFKEF